MAYLATNIFDGDGTTTEWEFSFAGVASDSDSGTTPYLYPEDVKALELYRDVDGNAQAATRNVTLVAPNRARIEGMAVAAGRRIKIYRQTEIRFPLVDYRDRQAVSDLDLDLANRQAIFVAQETQDAASNNMALDRNENYDVINRRIVNLAPGIDPGDAVNLDQLRHSVRVHESEPTIPELPSPVDRANKLLSFDSAGNPVATLPQSGSATDLELRLGLPGGAGLVGYLGFTVASALAAHTAGILSAESDITTLYDSVAEINTELTRTSRTVESFGPIGAGNDTPTLHLALTWLAGADGRTLHFYPGRVYIQGPGAVPVVYEGTTYYPARFNILDVDYWQIVGNGAVIRADTSLTDTQFNRGFHVRRCNDWVAQDLTYDGRLDARTEYGGDGFNNGNEITGNSKNGWLIVDCRNFATRRLGATRCMMDGIIVAGPDETAEDYAQISRNFMLIQNRSTFNYRQGCSVVGARDGLIIGGSYSDTGVLKGTLPMAGIDIEANFADRPNVNIGLIGVELARNYTGLAMTLAATACWALNCSYIENRAYGVMMSAATDCSVQGGRMFNTLAGAEPEMYAVYIMGSTACSVTGLKATVAGPHRGVFIGSGSIDCVVEDSRFADGTQILDPTFAQFLCRINADTLRCVVRNNHFIDSSGRLGFACLISSPSAVFTGNRIHSKWGSSGSGGVYVEAADLVTDNVVVGVAPGAGADGAGISLAPEATSVRQIGPNVDYLKPRLGGQVRRRGFTANVLHYIDPAIDLPAIALNGVHFFAITVPGAQVGDDVLVTFSDLSQYLHTVGRVTLPDTVLITVINTFTATDPGPQVMRVTVTANDI